MVGARLALRAGILVLAAGALGACATQPRDDVRVGIGTDLPHTVKAKDYAALYVPYAMMATAAYASEKDLNRHECPDAGLLARSRTGLSESDADYRKTVRDWIRYLNARGWECRFGAYGSLPCPKRTGDVKCHAVGGLEFNVWRRMEKGQCREAVIAFRGTDKNDIGDWIANFRWLYRLTPKFDQYAQVQTYIPKIVKRIQKNGCAHAQFMSSGHSLGGGLAQQAAYADSTDSIRYVYAFDPSPVTGFFDVSALVRDKSTDRLGIDRAYEAGEILALPRLIIENIFPPTLCHPRIRTVRFNLLKGFGITQHSIADLTKELKMVGRGGNPKRVANHRQASDCKGGPPTMMAPPA